MKILTLWNIVFPLSIIALLAYVVGFEVRPETSGMLDTLIAVLTWVLIIGTPFHAGAGYYVSKLGKWKPGKLINSLVGVVWLVGIVCSIVYPFWQ